MEYFSLYPTLPKLLGIKVGHYKMYTHVKKK